MSSPKKGNHASRNVVNSAAFLLPHLRPQMSLLDIGCGPGSITLGFSSYLHQGKVIGVDYSTDVIEKAQHALAEAGISNVTFQTASVFELPFEDNSFDVVYSHQMFPHLSDPVSAFKEIRRVLKPGGFVATRDADVYAWSPALPGLELYNQALARLQRYKGCTFPPGREMQRWAREADFSREKMTLGAGGTVYSSREEREWWSAVLGSGLANKDGGHRAKLIESGTVEEDIEIIVRDLKVWALGEDGQYTEYDCENIYRK